MSARITSSQKDQFIRVTEPPIRLECSNGFSGYSPEWLSENGPENYPKPQSKAKGTKPTKQTSLAKRLSLFIQCYNHLLNNHQRIFTHPNYQEPPNLLAFSFFNLKGNCTCILELNLSSPKAHLRMRYLTPKHNNKSHHQTLYIESILTITKFISYV